MMAKKPYEREHHAYTACPECDDVQNDCCPSCAGTDSYCPVCDCPADDCEFADDDEGRDLTKDIIDKEPEF